MEFALLWSPKFLTRYTSNHRNQRMPTNESHTYSSAASTDAGLLLSYSPPTYIHANYRAGYLAHSLALTLGPCIVHARNVGGEYPFVLLFVIVWASGS